jgi:hypothetical protein
MPRTSLKDIKKVGTPYRKCISPHVQSAQKGTPTNNNSFRDKEDFVQVKEKPAK